MVDIETNWSQFFPVTERNQIVSLLEQAGIAAGGETDDTLTLLQIQNILAEAAGIVVNPVNP